MAGDASWAMVVLDKSGVNMINMPKLGSKHSNTASYQTGSHNI